jgi:uncharacterized membrane protein YgcG
VIIMVDKRKTLVYPLKEKLIIAESPQFGGRRAAGVPPSGGAGKNAKTAIIGVRLSICGKVSPQIIRFKGMMMKMPLSKKDKRTVYTGLTGLMLAALVLATGCEGTSGPPGAPGVGKPGTPPGAPGPRAGQPPVSSKPAPAVGQPPKPAGPPVAVAPPSAPTQPASAEPAADPAEPKPAPAPITKIEQAGNEVALAAEILAAATNPFLSRLPKPNTLAVTPEGNVTPVENILPPPDPFESISLLGIVYNPKSPIALLSVGGGESQSQLVRNGEVLFVDGGQIKVTAIRQDGIELQSLGSGKEKRSLSLPSIVTYSGRDGAAGAGGSTGGGGGGASSGSGGGGHSHSHGGGGEGGASRASAALPNLKKLGQSDPADVVLHEP